MLRSDATGASQAALIARRNANITCSSSQGRTEPIDEEDTQMKVDSVAMERAIVPKRRQKHYSYDESVDEAGKLIADEPVEIEREVPAEENEPVGGTEANNSTESLAFEE
jgi:hypothetical protein